MPSKLFQQRQLSLDAVDVQIHCLFVALLSEFLFLLGTCLEAVCLFEHFCIFLLFGKFAVVNDVLPCLLLTLLLDLAQIVFIFRLRLWE